MSSNTGNRASASRKSKDQMIAGVLIGVVIGVSIAAGIAWYLMKSPSPFVQKSPVADKIPLGSAPPPAPGASVEPGPNDKPRFEFYKVLTDKQDRLAPPSKPSERPKAVESKPAADYEPRLLQAGSFQNVEDAEKLKAKLALLGVEANVQSASIPDKGIWYRVRLGPYKSAEAEDRARNFLKQNGVDSTPIRVQ